MSTTAPRASVLVSDDERDVRVLLRCVLERAGFEVHETGNGEETFTAALQLRPTVITTDILEPSVSGLDALALLKADASTCEIPVVVVTCMHDPDHRAKAMALGAADYLTKPMKLSRYVELVKSAAAAAAGSSPRPSTAPRRLGPRRLETKATDPTQQCPAEARKFQGTASDAVALPLTTVRGATPVSNRSHRQ